MRRERGRLGPGEAVLFVDRKGREYLRFLRPGTRVPLRGGTLEADSLIGSPEGSVVRTGSGEPFLVVRPTFAHLVPNLPRRAQVIYPKDIGPILLWGDIFPGARVVEVGAGPGALTIALLRAVGPEGSVVSYEHRPDFARMARENVHRFLGPATNWTLRVTDAFEGIEEREVDRMVVDLAEPWRLVEHAARALRPGGILVAYLPTVLQLKHLYDAIEGDRRFGNAETMETLLRFWHVKERSVRPEHRMIGHTGFVTVVHRLAEPGETTGATEEEETGIR
ncbi:MAG: tRNA (adenine-N1)-methyltransferase [Candidatus Binatia bacterium]|nr:MAG: tRNA (adenine-N1)-methyltransferase [Candidatus Binatia bacterium]